MPAFSTLIHGHLKARSCLTVMTVDACFFLCHTIRNGTKQSRPPLPNDLLDHRKSLGRAARVPAVRVSEADNVVPIIICASEERMGATMATINSVYSNTDASVFFYIVTLRDAVKLTRCATLNINL